MGHPGDRQVGGLTLIVWHFLAPMAELDRVRSSGGLRVDLALIIIALSAFGLITSTIVEPLSPIIFYVLIFFS